MKCPECLNENDVSAKRCSTCNYRFVRPQAMPGRQSGFYAQYFAFRTLVTPHLIKSVYIVGACVLTGAGVLLIMSPDNLTGIAEDPIFARFGGILLFLVGNLVWRMLCEGAILLFSLHEILVSIDNHAKAFLERAEVTRS